MNSVRQVITIVLVSIPAMLLLVAGADIVIDEIELLGADEVLRVADRREPNLTAEEVRKAADKFDSIDQERSDLLFGRLHMKVVFTQQRANSAGRSEVLSSEQRQLVQASKDLLAAAPAKALGWCTLAHATLALKGVNAGWRPALELCYATARRELGVVFRRIRIGLQLWPILGNDLRRLVRNDLITLLSSPGLANRASYILPRMVATVAPQRAQMVRELIATYQPDQAGRFDRVLAAAMPREVDR